MKVFCICPKFFIALNLGCRYPSVPRELLKVNPVQSSVAKENVVFLSIAVRPMNMAFSVLMCKNLASMQIMVAPMFYPKSTVEAILNRVLQAACHVMWSGTVGHCAPRKGKSTFRLLRSIPSFETNSLVGIDPY